MLSVSLKGVLDINELAEKVSTSLKGALYLQKIGFVIKDVKREDFYVLIEEGFRREVSYISMKDEVIGYLHERSHLEPELVEIDPSLGYLKESRFYQFLKEEDIPLVMSISFGEDFIGFIVLGKRENLQSYTMRDIQILESIAGDISIYFYNALHHRDILEKQRLEQEILLAKNIQDNLLPQEFPEIKGISLYGIYSPARELGGDYYDFLISRRESEYGVERRIYITIGDVSGKGLDAGLVASSVKSSLMSLIKTFVNPREILRLLNEVICEENSRAEVCFVVAFYV